MCIISLPEHFNSLLQFDILSRTLYLHLQVHFTILLQNIIYCSLIAYFTQFTKLNLVKKKTNVETQQTNRKMGKTQMKDEQKNT